MRYVNTASANRIPNNINSIGKLIRFFITDKILTIVNRLSTRHDLCPGIDVRKVIA